MSAKIIEKLTKSIDKDIKRLEVSFAPALTGAVAVGFFTSKSSEVLPIIAKCITAKNAIPPAPGGLIKRSQFNFIEKKLKGFGTEDFPVLETHLTTFLTAPEPTTRAGALSQIAAKIPGILADYILMKLELKKVKKALRV